MGMRTNSEIIFQIGRNNALVDKVLDESMTSVLDTLDHATTHEGTLAASETNYVVPFGDVALARLVYIRADGAIRVTPGGGLATSAQADGVGGTYVTAFAGGETLLFEVDNVAVAVVFDGTDQSLAQVINRINSFVALAGVSGPGGIPATVARTNGATELRLVSPTTGIASEIDVQSGTGRATLGLAVAVTNGVNSTAGQTPLTLTKPANVNASDGAAGVPVFFFGTLQTASLTVENLETAAETRILVGIAGDVITTPVC